MANQNSDYGSSRSEFRRANPNKEFSNDSSDTIARKLANNNKSPINQDASITVSGKAGHKPRFGEYSLPELMSDSVIEKTQNITNQVSDSLKTASSTISTIFSRLGEITGVGLDTAASNPAAVTTLAGIGGLIAGVKALRNISKSASIGINPMKDPKLGWLPYAFLGILQGGLFFGLTSTFFGKHNLFTEQIDGRPVVRIKTLLGAALAPFILGIFITLAQGRSALRNIPLLGPALEDICKTVFGAAKSITVGTEENSNPMNPGAIPSQMGA